MHRMLRARLPLLPRSRRWRAAIAFAMIVSAAWVAGGGYYAQVTFGHLKLMLEREPIEHLVQRADTDDKLRARLEFVREIRTFASRELALPDNRSYRQFVELDREQLLWSVMALPEFSLRPKQWCYPVIGCQSYRSYFQEDRARDMGAQLEAQGHEAIVRPVGAYSTLGWFADPVTNSMLRRGDLSLAELIFHELAHQEVFVRGDTMFNEGYATFVGEQGVREWLRAREQYTALERWESRQQRVHRFNALLREKRGELVHLYASDLPVEAMRHRKNAIFDSIRVSFEQQLVADDPEMADLASWFNRPITNARLASVALYRHWVAAFDALFREVGGDWDAFHAGVAELARSTEPEREVRLNAYLEVSPSANAGARQTASGPH
jgi:predicted aminopeptidase